MERALCVIKRALHSVKRALHSVKRVSIFYPKKSAFYGKRPTFYRKSLICHQKSPSFHQKSPVFCQKSPALYQMSMKRVPYEFPIQRTTFKKYSKHHNSVIFSMNVKYQKKSPSKTFNKCIISKESCVHLKKSRKP